MREATKEEKDSVNRYIESISKPIGTVFYDEEDGVAIFSKPKTIARIKLCGGAMTFDITDYMSWKRPTKEQIRNLHDMLCIDVEILKDGE